MQTAGTPDSSTKRVHKGEWGAAGLSALYFFSVLSAYYVVRPVREQFSAAVGSTNLPWFYLATFIATLLLTPVFAWLSANYPRRIVVPGVYAFFIACLLGFIPLFNQQGLMTPRELGTLFFVWVSVFNLFVVSVFWTFMTDIWRPEQAKRLFPMIALGGTIGTIVGPMLTRSLVNVIGVAPLLAVSALLLCGSFVCIVLLSRWSSATATATERASYDKGVGGSMFDGLKQIFTNPFVGGMAILMLLGDGIGTVNYALVADYTGQTFTDAAQRTAFAANVDLATNSLVVITQLVLTRWILTRWGIVPAVLIWAFGATLSLLAVALVPDAGAAINGASSAAASAQLTGGLWPFVMNMPWVVMALVVSRALMYGILGPARESMFAAVPRNLRYQGKNAVDTAVWRFGDLAISTSMSAMKSIGTTVGQFAGVAAAAGLAAAWVGYRLARNAERSRTDTDQDDSQ